MMHCKQEADRCGQGIPTATDGITCQSKEMSEARMITLGQSQLADRRCDGVDALQHEHVDSSPQYAPPLEDRSGKHKHGLLINHTACTLALRKPPPSRGVSRLSHVESLNLYLHDHHTTAQRSTSHTHASNVDHNSLCLLRITYTYLQVGTFLGPFLAFHLRLTLASFTSVLMT
jgi:hypothetical protein